MRTEEKENWSKTPLGLINHKNHNLETYNDKMRGDKTQCEKTGGIR